MSIDWPSHFVDFFVILGADIGAAYFAIKIFESRSADRERKEKSLSVLYQLATRLREFVHNKRASITPHDQMEARIPSDLTETDRSFEDINDDFLFWHFKAVKIFREHYNTIRLQKKKIYISQSARELRSTMDVLIENLDSLKKDIEAELSTKIPWWKICK